jgi:hypothetical protein
MVMAKMKGKMFGGEGKKCWIGWHAHNFIGFCDGQKWRKRKWTSFPGVATYFIASHKKILNN